jgi:hypothetical protein
MTLQVIHARSALGWLGAHGSPGGDRVSSRRPSRRGVKPVAICTGQLYPPSLAGRGQADITALGAAATARSLIDGQVSQPGVWLAEQIVAPTQFMQHLAAKGVVPRVDSVGLPARESNGPNGAYEAQRHHLPTRE